MQALHLARDSLEDHDGARAAERFGIFEAGVQSARDPRYTVQPQRERVQRGG